MRFVSTGCAVLALCAGVANAQTPGTGAPVQYDVRFDNAVHHEARITVTYRDIGQAPLRLQMSRSSPGRYALHEFAKNVYSVSAKDGAGRPLQVSRTDPYGWTVAGHDGTVSVSYTLFGDRADGTYAQIDATHAHLNIPATFMWASGFDERPINVRFRPYDDQWKVATQLPPAPERNSFWAPSLQYFMDSPTELSNHAVREWQIQDEDGSQTIRLTVHHAGTEQDVDRFAAKAKKVVDQQIAMFGDAPNFDFGRYTFLADYMPQTSGDGMEHRNSTVISSSRQLRAENFSQLDTLSHEFFHAWNVERLRPAELEPFDFTRANPTPSLWLAEGFTNYYGPLMIRRAGESSIDDYLQDLSGALNFVLNRPGRHYGSPQEMSLRAPFVDAAQSIDPTNPNIFTSYYVYGSIIALALDLTLRQRPEGLSLDHYMRHLWKTHGVPEKSYTTGDLRSRLAEVTKDASFAQSFFAGTVQGNSLPDFAPLLAQAGLKLRPANAKRAYIGPAEVKVAEKTVTLTSSAMPGTGLYNAGLERGDEIVSMGGSSIHSEADWNSALARHVPGDQTEIRFIQRGVERRAQISFAADPAVEVVRYEAAGLTVTPAQQAFREAWLGRDTKPD